MILNLKDQQHNLMLPLSAPKSRSRLRESTDMVVNTPLNTSVCSLDTVKVASGVTFEWTPILLAVVADMTADLKKPRQ